MSWRKVEQTEPIQSHDNKNILNTNYRGTENKMTAMQLQLKLLAHVGLPCEIEVDSVADNGPQFLAKLFTRGFTFVNQERLNRKTHSTRAICNKNNKSETFSRVFNVKGLGLSERASEWPLKYAYSLLTHFPATLSPRQPSNFLMSCQEWYSWAKRSPIRHSSLHTASKHEGERYSIGLQRQNSV